MFNTFEEAIEVFSRRWNFRQEIGDKTQKRHFMYPWEFTERVSNIDQDVALVFGEEGKGLSTDDFAVIILSHFHMGRLSNNDLSHAVHTLTCAASPSSPRKSRSGRGAS